MRYSALLAGNRSVSETQHVEMVQIFIKMVPETGKWTIIELQGELQTREDTSLEGRTTGDLHFDDKGVPYLIIGHHLLTGKVVELEKPFAVLKKSPIGVGKGESEEDTGAVHYDVAALVKRKIIFKTRPKPIITKSVLVKR